MWAGPFLLFPEFILYRSVCYVAAVAGDRAASALRFFMLAGLSNASIFARASALHFVPAVEQWVFRFVVDGATVVHARGKT